MPGREPGSPVLSHGFCGRRAGSSVRHATWRSQEATATVAPAADCWSFACCRRDLQPHATDDSKRSARVTWKACLHSLGKAHDSACVYFPASVPPACIEIVWHAVQAHRRLPRTHSEARVHRDLRGASEYLADSPSRVQNFTFDPVRISTGFMGLASDSDSGATLGASAYVFLESCNENAGNISPFD